MPTVVTFSFPLDITHTRELKAQKTDVISHLKSVYKNADDQVMFNNNALNYNFLTFYGNNNNTCMYCIELFMFLC